MTFTILELILATGLAYATGVGSYLAWQRRQDGKSNDRVLVLENQDMTVMLSDRTIHNIMLSYQQCDKPDSELH